MKFNRDLMSNQATGRTKAEMRAFRASEAAMDTKGTMQLRRPRDSKGKEIEAEWDDNWPLTKEGPDYWKIHMKKMKDEGKIDEEIKHTFNMDWSFSHESMENYFTRVSLDPAFLPRKGELVLWVYNMDGDLFLDWKAQSWVVRGEDGTLKGMPEWRAGIITQTPEEKTSYEDIMHTTKKMNPSVSYHGFRVETLSDPIGDDKSYSSQYRYVPLKCIKPLNDWERWVHGRPREAWHPSIEFALTVMSSWCTVSNTRFVGTWPNARIHARGLWLGAELIAAKDTIRLKPVGQDPDDMMRDGYVEYLDTDPVDVMAVHKIALDLQGCQEDPENPQLAENVACLVSGKIYTRDKNRLDRPTPFSKEPLEEMTVDEVNTAFNQIHMADYGPWYRMCAGKFCVVNQSMILGRCYEPLPTACFYNTDRLDYDMHSILTGRRFSSQVDRRIPPGIGWFWGDNRAQILGLAEVNGIEVGPAADQRETPEKWQAFLKIRAGRPYTQEDWDLAGLPDSGGRKSKNTQFKGLCKTSTMVKTGLGARSSDDDDDEDSEKGLSEAELSRPIPYREEESDDEDEEKEEFDEKAANALL